MKSLFYVVGFALMIWALIEQSKEKPNLVVEIAAVIVFFFMMMRLMNKTPGKFDAKTEEKQNESTDEDR